MFCCTLLYGHSSIAIILMGKRELIALLYLSSLCLVMVGRLFLAVPRGCLQFVIVAFPDHTHLLFLSYPVYSPATKTRQALSDVYRIFTTSVHLAIQIACFDAIFDCITNMIGRLLHLHIVKSTPNNQAWKIRGFLIFILTLTSHFTFSNVFIL